MQNTEVQRDSTGKLIIPEGYYVLSPDDIIEKGDYFRHRDNENHWYKTGDFNLNRKTSFNAEECYPYIRKIENMTNKVTNPEIQSLLNQKLSINQKIKDLERLEQEKREKEIRRKDYEMYKTNMFNNLIIGNYVVFDDQYSEFNGNVFFLNMGETY